jgi:hypothetical protein
MAVLFDHIRLLTIFDHTRLVVLSDHTLLVALLVTCFWLYLDHILQVVLFYHILWVVLLYHMLLVVLFDHTLVIVSLNTYISCNINHIILVVLLITYCLLYYSITYLGYIIGSYTFGRIIDRMLLVALFITYFRSYMITYFWLYYLITYLWLCYCIILVVSLIDGLNYWSHILAVLYINYFCFTILFNPILTVCLKKV